MIFINARLATLLLVLSACASCVERPHRPDAPLCTPLTDFTGKGLGEFECTDARGEFRVPNSDVIGTTLDGYLTLERYIDTLEKKLMRRGCEL